MKKFEIHFSKSLENKSGTTNPRLLELLANVWKFETFEASDEEAAVQKLFNKYGKERINYILSVTPVLHRTHNLHS